MDHLSSSSSLTGTTIYTQQSDSTFHQNVPRQTYTTAGTIYNPTNAQPLQPPVRRGRTLKWPPPGSSASELSLFPKSILANLPMKAQAFCTTPTSPLPNQIPKYSPLQQNYDRAVSPLTDHSRESPNDLDIRSLSTSGMSSFTTINTPQVSPVEVISPAVIMEKHVVDADSSDEENDESTAENPLRGLTVKSLHNLASYPNPNQKRAQRALLRARPGVTPAPSAGTNGSRSTAPAFNGVACPGDATDIFKGGLRSPGLFRSAKSDSKNILKLQLETKPARDLSGHWRAGVGANGVAPSPGLSNGRTMQRSAPIGGYKSTLATGPGAPLPLTAGPPGQRQYRASTFEPTMKALQTGPKIEIASEKSITPDIRAAPPGLYKTASHDLFRQSAATPDYLKASLPLLVEQSEPDIIDWMNSFDRASTAGMEKMLDAIMRSDDRVGKEITDINQSMGAPFVRNRDYFSLGNALDDDMLLWTRHARPPLKLGTSRITDEELCARNERISRHFYSGTGELGRSLESVLQDAEDRQFKRQIGVIGDGRPKPKPKAEYPPMTAQMVNNMTDQEATEPFMTMAFSSLLSHVESGIKRDRFHQWTDPATSLIDRSNEGRNSVFGN